MSDNFTAVFREVGSERVDPAIVEVAINNYMKDHPGAGAVTEEQISNIVTAYLQNHPIEGGVNAEEVNTAIESYLQANPVVGEKGEKGDKGDTGADGKSAYEIAVENGFEGTEQEWLASLQGEGDIKKSFMASLWHPFPEEGSGNAPTITAKHSNGSVEFESASALTYYGAQFKCYQLADFTNIKKAVVKFYTPDNEWNCYLQNTSSAPTQVQPTWETDHFEYVVTQQTVQSLKLKLPIIAYMTKRFESASYTLGCEYEITYSDSLQDIKEDVKKLPLEGVKTLFMGDSITAFKNSQSWVEKFCTLTRCDKVDNVAFPSAMIADKESGYVPDGNPQTGNNTSNVFSNHVQLVLDNDYEDIDLIIIMLGTNGGIATSDETIQAQCVTNLDNVDRTTIEGAIWWGVEKLHQKYPDAVICWCSPIWQGGSNRLAVPRWDDNLKRMCQICGIEQIHTLNCGMNVKDTTENVYYADSLHPNEKGAWRMAEYIANATAQLFIYRKPIQANN